MKKIIIALGIAGLFAAPITLACDEACQREKAAKQTGQEFPSYLTWKYCDGIAGEFMTSTMKSLQSYTEQHLDVNRRRGMRNIQNYLEQRKEWLTECDNYVAATGKGRIFRDTKTTEKIIAAIDNVNGELASLLKGVTYANQDGDDTQVAQTKFNELFTLVDNHKNVLLLKGHMITSR
jgi:hypothetical protein